jgi:hypothetical protein
VLARRAKLFLFTRKNRGRDAQMIARWLACITQVMGM